MSSLPPCDTKTQKARLAIQMIAGIGAYAIAKSVLKNYPVLIKPGPLAIPMRVAVGLAGLVVMSVATASVEHHAGNYFDALTGPFLANIEKAKNA